VPVFGLVPLGEDAKSGLWEFVLATTGSTPARDASTPSGWRLEPDNGVVLVLLPGGRSIMGAPDGAPPASANARPAHLVELDPFLLSKFELTRAQATRMGLAASPATLPEDGCLPTYVDWHRARALLANVGLVLPTEAQWEHAARAGTSGPDWPLEGIANVLDKTLAEGWRLQGFLVNADSTEIDDGRAGTAPVGSYAPNGFGLHDTLGNVAEWCQDPLIWRGYSSLIPRQGDGLRDTVAVEGLKAVRGGSYIDSPSAISPWMRGYLAPATLNSSTGLRPAMRIRME
jgi:formylglycine-generating enzyme required for sulfatase activity